jgi:hypothetical protein
LKYFAGVRLVDAEDVVEAAVLADDHDQVLDRRGGFGICAARRHGDGAECED